LRPNPRITVQRLRSVAAKLPKIDEELQLVSEELVGKSGNAGPVVLRFCALGRGPAASRTSRSMAATSAVPANSVSL